MCIEHAMRRYAMSRLPQSAWTLLGNGMIFVVGGWDKVALHWRWKGTPAARGKAFAVVGGTECASLLVGVFQN